MQDLLNKVVVESIVRFCMSVLHVAYLYQKSEGQLKV